MLNAFGRSQGGRSQGGRLERDGLTVYGVNAKSQLLKAIWLRTTSYQLK